MQKFLDQNSCQAAQAGSKQAAREALESPSLQVILKNADVALGDTVEDELGSVRLVVGLNDLKDLSQPK